MMDFARCASAPSVILLIFTLACTTHAQSANGRHDTQNWNDVNLTIGLDKKVDLTLLSTLRFGRSLSRPVDERVGFSFTFKPKKYLSITPGYLYLATQPLKNQKAFENRLSLAVTPKVMVGKFTFSDRNLFERRFRHPQVDSTRYRNKLQVDHPIKIGDTKFYGLMADEIFYDWSLKAWVRNRFTVGAGKTFTKHFTGEIYFLRQNDSHTKPGDLNVIGTNFRFHL
jgi:hypothetical protein